MVVEKGFKKTDVGVIPDHWKIKSLNEISTITRLAGYEYSTMWKEEINGEIIALRGFNIGQNRIIEREFVRISNELSLRLKRSRLYKGNVVYPCVGSIGNAVVIEEDDKYHIQQNIAKIIPNESQIFPLFLSYYLMSDFGFKEIQKFNGSSSQPNILVGSLRKYSIIQPPLPEQTAIATALSDMDTLISQTEKLIEKKKAIKQGVMQELLRPKEGWVTKKLDEVAIFRRGSFPQPYGLDKWYDDISGKPFVQVYDVDENKKLKNETKRYISSEAQLMSVFAKKGTIILTIQGSIGRIAITQYDAYIDRTLLIFESFKYDFDNYFFMHIIHQLFDLEKQNAPGGIIKTITKEALKNFKISFPDFAEQKNIGIIISDLESEILLIENKLHKLKHQKQGMMQALLTGKIRLI